MNPTIESIAIATLARVEAGRREKARIGLEDDTMRVSILGGPHGIDALVRRGEGEYTSEYGVFISEHVAACSCKDYEHRLQPCKHIAVVCLFFLGSTTPECKQPFALYDVVQLRGLNYRQGKVVCISGEII